MRRKVMVLGLALVLLGSACRQDGPATLPSPAATASPSPAPVAPVLETFTLEGEVTDAWGTAPANAGGAVGPASAPGAPPAGKETATGTPPAGDRSPAASPGQANAAPTNKAGSGALTVSLTSYFSESGCRFNPGDVVVIRFTPATTVEPPEAANDAVFPNNLEKVPVTVSGNLLESGANCLPVADSITLLEGASAAPSPTATQARARARARTSRTGGRTPSPTPLDGATGNQAQQGGSNTGTSSITGPAANNDSSSRNGGEQQEEEDAGDFLSEDPSDGADPDETLEQDTGEDEPGIGSDGNSGEDMGGNDETGAQE